MNITVSNDTHTTIQWLNRDLSHNVIVLKYLQSYGQYSQCWYAELEGQAGALAMVPTRYVSFDYHSYPDTDYVVLPVFRDAAIAEALLEHVPFERKLLYKMPSLYEYELISKHTHLQRIQAYRSFSNLAGHQFEAIDGIVVSDQLEDSCLALYEQQGHDREEVCELFEQGLAFSCSKYQAGQAVCSSYIFQNFGPVWEVAGLFTLPSARRQGLAKQVVQTALAELQQRGLTPRYVAHEANIASQQLAQSLGLEHFMDFTHYRN